MGMLKLFIYITLLLSNNDKIVLSFNGEIFNYKEIKSELITLGHSFLSQTDTFTNLVTN